MKKHAIAVALGLLTIAIPAFAGQRTNLSDIPALPKPKDITSPKDYGVAGLTLHERQTQRSSYYESTASTKQGYCIVRQEGFLELSESTTEQDGGELWRFTEADGKANLERTRYQVAPYLDNAWVKSKNTVELKALASDLGVTIWGMRTETGDVVVLAKAANGGRETVKSAEEKEMTLMSFASSSCTYGAVRISAYTIAHGGGIAQMNGHLPAVGEGKAKVEPQFLVDVSAFKVSRDPEPVISVRIRKVDP
jgi:hypothetical protein